MQQESILIEDGFIAPFYIKITGNNFDVYETVTSRKRDKDTKLLTDEKYQREKLQGSRTSIGEALRMIIQFKAIRGHKKMETLRDFYARFNQIRSDINAAILLIDASPVDKMIELEKRIKALESKQS